jgi:hypothetical protein
MTDFESAVEAEALEPALAARPWPASGYFTSMIAGYTN